MHVVGTYECKLDPKGRVKLPGSLVKQLKGGETFVLKRSVFQKCLELYTLEEWSAMMEKVNKLNRFRKKNNDFIRRFTAGVKMIDIDATTRILVPKDLLGIASLNKSLVLCCDPSIMTHRGLGKIQSHKKRQYPLSKRFHCRSHFPTTLK